MEHIDVKFTGELSKTSKLFLKYKERKRLHRYCFRLLFFAFLFLVIMMIMGFIPQVNDNKGIMLTPGSFCGEQSRSIHETILSIQKVPHKI